MRLWWEKMVKDEKFKWVQREATEEEVRDKRRALLCKIYEDPDYFHQAFDGSSEEQLIPGPGNNKSEDREVLRGRRRNDSKLFYQIFDSSSKKLPPTPRRASAIGTSSNLSPRSIPANHRAAHGGYSYLERHSRHPHSHNRNQLRPA